MRYAYFCVNTVVCDVGIIRRSAEIRFLMFCLVGAGHTEYGCLITCIVTLLGSALMLLCDAMGHGRLFCGNAEMSYNIMHYDQL